MTRTEGVESRPLGVANENILSVSSSGMLVLLPGRILAHVPLSGGSPRELYTDITGASWFPDGTRLVIARRVGQKATLEFPPGKVIYESRYNLEMIRVSPKSDLIAFNERTFGSNGMVVIIDLTGKKRASTKDLYPFGVAWEPEGKELWYSSWNLEPGCGTMLRGLDSAGKDRLIQNFPFSTYLLDISSAGKALLSFDEDRRITRGRLLEEPDETEYSWLDGTNICDFSDDGKTMLFHENYEASESPSGTIYIRKTDGSPAVRLAGGVPASFSPDGKWVVGVNGDQIIILVPIGAGEIKKFPNKLEIAFPHGFFPAGNDLLVLGNEKGKGVRFYIMNLLDGSLRPVTPELRFSNNSEDCEASFSGWESLLRKRCGSEILRLSL